MELNGKKQPVQAQIYNPIDTIDVGNTNRIRIVLSTISSDAHTWNLVYLQLLMEEIGHEVINLGACTPDEVIINTCLQQQPQLLVISSVNGHGHIDGDRMIRALRKHSQLHALPAVIGGKLGVLGSNLPFYQQLISAGFNAVFDSGNALTIFKESIQSIAIGSALSPSLEAQS